MINFQFTLASVIGILIAAGGVALYALRSFRPELSRDHDLFFAAVSLVYGVILLTYSWKYDPLMQFGELMLGGSAIFFAFDNIRMRGITTKQAKQRSSSPIVDDDRPVSRVYRAELDELNPVDERPITRRIRGSRDVRSNREEYDEYDDGSRRRSSSRDERLGPGERPRKRRPRTEDRPVETRSGREDADFGSDVWEDKPARKSSGGSSRPGNRNPETASRPRRPRPSEGSGSRPDPEVNTSTSDYVDYRPVDPDEEDNWS